MAMSHDMFYAPEVTDKDIGGEFNSEFPFILGPSGDNYIILLVGDAESERLHDLGRTCARTSPTSVMRFTLAHKRLLE